VYSDDTLEGFPLDHVAVAVQSIGAVVPAFEAVTGATASPVEPVASQGVAVCFIGAGATKIELIEPLTADTPVARFLARRGAGLHHIAYRVDDIEATLDDLAGRGFDLIDRTPRPGALGHRVAFIHPRSTGGVLVELVQHGPASSSP
jgi:methylmalonyl-CoA/ethylmalonyl-CoA epimerase